MTLRLPSMKNTCKSIPWSMRMEAADIKIVLYGPEARSELKMLKELEESVWIASRDGVRWKEADQWSAAKMAVASLRKMLNDVLSSTTVSPTKPVESWGTQKASPSLLASHHT